MTKYKEKPTLSLLQGNKLVAYKIKIPQDSIC